MEQEVELSRDTFNKKAVELGLAKEGENAYEEYKERYLRVAQTDSPKPDDLNLLRKYEPVVLSCQKEMPSTDDVRKFFEKIFIDFSGKIGPQVVGKTLENYLIEKGLPPFPRWDFDFDKQYNAIVEYFGLVSKEFEKTGSLKDLLTRYEELCKKIISKSFQEYVDENIKKMDEKIPEQAKLDYLRTGYYTQVLEELDKRLGLPTPAPPVAVQNENYVYQYVPRFWSDTLVVHEVQKDKSLKFIGEYNPFGAVCKKIKGAEVKDLPTEVVSNIVNVYIKQHQIAKEMPIQLGDVSGVIRQQGEKIEISYKNLTYTVKGDALLDKNNKVVTEPGALKLFNLYKANKSQERSWLEDALGISNDN